MPDIPLDKDEAGQPRSRAEALIIKQLEAGRRWGEGVGHDIKGMKLLAVMIDLITRTISRQQASFNVLFRMARPEDNELLRNKVMEILPGGWRTVEGESTRERRKRTKFFPE